MLLGNVSRVTLTELPGSPALYVYGDQDIVSQYINNNWTWEKEELTELLWAMEQPLPTQQKRGGPPLFLDIGANVGWFVINVAARGYDVAAFEGGMSDFDIPHVMSSLSPQGLSFSACRRFILQEC